MRYFSMFSGIGGFELGITRGMGLKSADTESKPPKSKVFERRLRSIMEEGRSLLSTDNGRFRAVCVGRSEVDEYANRIYDRHFEGHKNYGDCTQIRWKEVPRFDLFVGGFPCQAFSIAGQRRGFDDTRGTLFFEIARCVREKQPRFLLLENVKGLLSHNKGHTFLTILSTLDELGYDCQWQVLNTSAWLPQNRERIFIIGHSRGRSRPKVFPLSDNGQVLDEGQRQISPTITSRYYKQGQSDPYLVRSNEKSVQARGDKPDDTNRIRRATYTDGSTVRKFTPKECERLQGFPDDWTEGISDTQRYKCVGNAVSVDVIEAIIKQWL